MTLNLKRESESPVTIRIEPNPKNAVDKIKKFIEAYNNYIEYSSELVFVERAKNPTPGAKQTVRTGLFVGDSTIIRLENTVKTVVNSAYPSRADNPIKVITQLGVSTGAINSEWETIKSGKLILDEEKFITVVQENPEGVKEFFGSDTDGDTRIDNGMAFKLQQALKPYTMAGKNIIQTKIDYEDNAIKSNEERISRHQEHLIKYEDKLRKKFAAMEKAISGSKAQSNWLKQYMNSDKEEK
ncbi:MAG: flagellar filament capping protein FliD [Spirochaetes bacterium]|nr:flagellar filament capping protein FliD [Spirochaetota bacterium]